MKDINSLESTVIREDKGTFLDRLRKKRRAIVLGSALYALTSFGGLATSAYAQTPEVVKEETTPPVDYVYSKDDFKGKSLEEIKEFIGYDQKKLEAFITKFINYRAEPPGIDEIKYPEVTLKERGGDCEDIALLIAKLIEGKYDSKLYFFKIREKNSNRVISKHIITIYKDEKGWRTVMYSTPVFRIKEGITPAFQTPKEVLNYTAEEFGGWFDEKSHSWYNNQDELINYYVHNPVTPDGDIKKIKEF